MGCEGCLISAKGQAQTLDAVRAEAKKYAIENETTVAIYKEGNDYRYTSAETAVRAGIPVLEYLSGAQ